MHDGVRAVLSAVFVLGLATPALAQSSVEQARARFDEGTRLYSEGRYVEAAQAYEASYRLSPRSATLLNVATAYERALELGRAADALDRYLAAEPDASDADQVRARAARLRQLDPGARAGPAPQTTSAPVGWTSSPRRRRPLAISELGIAAIAVGGAALLITVAAIIAGAVALDHGATAGERCNDDGVCASTARDSVTTARDASLAADVLGTIGAAVGTAAVVLTIVAILDGESSDDVALDGRGVGVRF